MMEIHEKQLSVSFLKLSESHRSFLLMKLCGDQLDTQELRRLLVRITWSNPICTFNHYIKSVWEDSFDLSVIACNSPSVWRQRVKVTVAFSMMMQNWSDILALGQRTAGLSFNCLISTRRNYKENYIYFSDIEINTTTNNNNNNVATEKCLVSITVSRTCVRLQFVDSRLRTRYIVSQC